MVTACVIADDLTGANATGALLATTGLRAAVILDLEGLRGVAGSAYEALVGDAASRAAPPDEARRRVRAWVSALCAAAPRAQFSKRIDSTLRGNVAEEVDAALEELHAQAAAPSGRGTPPVEMAVVVPAFPASHRITVGGHQIVRVRPESSEPAASEPAGSEPARSFVPDLFRRGVSGRVQRVPIDTVARGVEAVAERLLHARDAGARIVVVDACTDSDIRVIAAAAAQLPFGVLAVDPGPFTAMLVALLGQVDARWQARAQPQAQIPAQAQPQDAAVSEPPALGPRVVLAVIGSVTRLTRVQANRLKAKIPHAAVAVDARRLACGGEPAALAVDEAVREAVSRVSALLRQRSGDSRAALIVESSAGPADALSPETLDKLAGAAGSAPGCAAANVARGLAEVAARLMDVVQPRPCGLYLTGGDVARAVMTRLGATLIEPAGCVLPLSAYGRAFGGACDGLPIVTKGGLVGGEDAAVRCVAHLLGTPAG